MDFEDCAEIKRLKSRLSIELLWIYILKLLGEKSLHGYIIRKEIEKNFGFLPGNVTSYVVLYKLESRGFVKTAKEENKIVYTLTPKGKKLFDAGRKEWERTSKKLFS